MNLPKHTASFSGGMNKDISYNQYPNTCYFDAENLRLITGDSDGLTSEALTIPKGNAVSFTLPADMIMLGHVVLRDYLIILAHDSAVGANPDKIYRIAISSLREAGDLTIDNTYYWLGGTHYLVYENDLGFDLDYPIRVVGNYENTDVQKIYWCDGINTLKHLNTIYNATYNDLSILDPSLLEILPNNTYGSYTLVEDSGGNLKAGRIQYSYQLYSISGTETLFAPPSRLYNLVTYDLSAGRDFAGNELETVINKSIIVTITLPIGTEDVFNRIRIVALEYEAYGDVPTVRVVSEQELTSNVAILTDIGNTVGELSLEDFQLVKHEFIPKTLETKNNYLFAGNITEEYFDIDNLVNDLDPANTFFDSRAYRWRYDSGTGLYDCTINKGDANEVVIDNGGGGGPDYTLVSEDHDCLNKYNNITNDTDLLYTYDYKYKYGGADPPVIGNLGGSGRIISYGFTHPGADILAGQFDSRGAEFVFSILPYSGYCDPSIVYDYTGYPRDEVMRFGVVLFDLDGRPSYPKWIADIRMPDIVEELNPGTTYSDEYKFCVADGISPDQYLNIRPLGVQFTINWDNIETDYPGLLDLLSGYQIVRMPRTSIDSTILAQGIILPTHYPTTVAGYIQAGYYSSYNITSARDYETGGVVTAIAGITDVHSNISKKECIEFISPEIAVNKNIILDRTNDFLEVCGYITNISVGSGTHLTNEKSYSVIAMTITGYEPTPTLISDWRRSITDGFISAPEAKSPVPYIVNTYPYIARGYDDTLTATSPEMTYKGTSFIASIPSAFTNVSPGGGAGTEEAIYGRYRRLMGHSIYGGATYTSRTYNSYIRAGDFTEVSLAGSTTFDIYGGDTYICPFNFAKLFCDNNAEYGTSPNANTGQCIVSFPVESKINLCLRLDKFNKYLTGLNNMNYRIAELQSIGVSQYPNYYPNNCGDLYRYNSAYSAIDISKSYISKPFDFRDTEVNDTIVTSSDIKLNGEYSDSWLSFRYNNYKELEGEYGPITRLINTNSDKLVCFQSRAISTLSVLEREVVQTQNTESLSVGTGGVLSRYDYLSRDSGTSLYDGIVSTDIGVYYYDENNKRISRILNNLESISDVKGLKSYLYSRDVLQMIGAYDKENREVIFTTTSQNSVPGLSDVYTVCLSGYKDLFTGFYNYGPFDTTSKYITLDKYLISSIDANKFYLHNVGDYNEFFGSNLTSSLSLIINPLKENAVSFHILEWLTDLTLAGVDDLTTTFDSVRVTNTHQDTGVITLAGNDDLRRRFRKWRLNVFRNAADSKRIRDSWMKVVFSYATDSDHKKLVIHPIETLYLPTKVQ